MEFSDVLSNRRSIRKFKNIPVEWEKVVAVLDAGRKAPSSGNLQNWRFIVVTDKERKKLLAQICYDQSFIATAPVCIIICSNTAKVTSFYHDKGLLYAIMNCAACAENMLLEATNQGLGSCWISSFDEKEIKEKFGLHQDTDAFIVIALGYADEKPPAPAHEELYALTFLERYGNRIKDIDAVL